MNLSCDLSLAERYKSESQRARVLTESWFARNVYCLACDADEVRQTSANTKATDFICPKCKHRYELKAVKKSNPKSIPDGAFETMLQKVTTGEAPTLCLLERTPDWHVRGLTAIHSSFLMPAMIVARPPLGPEARRAGWVGCNIRLDGIETDGEVDVISKGVVQPEKEVRRRFQRFLPLAGKSADARGWTLLTLRLVRGMGMKEFSLADIYKLEGQFGKAYPGNRHVRDKIRQQLQILRDLGLLAFEGRGEYRLLD